MAEENKKKILVVDDEPDILNILEQRFKTVDYEVRTARDGQEALNRLRGFIPDLVVVDILMPVMDGFTFYKEFRKNPAMGNIPIIVLTARSKMEDTFKAIGVDAFITKPFDAQVMLAKADELIEKAKQAIPAAGGVASEDQATKDEALRAPTTPAKRKSFARIGVYIFLGFFILVILGVIIGLYYLFTHAGSGASDPFSG